MLKTAFDKKFFENFREWINKGLPFLLATLSFVFFVLAAFVFKESEWSTIFNSSGSTILAAAVFSSVIKSRFFTEVFISILQDILYAKSFLEKRNDLEQIWKNVSDEICEQKFPELKKEIDNAIFDNYLPKTREFYYQNIDKNFTINGISDDGKFINCKDITTLTLCPHDKAKKIVYSYRYDASTGGGVISNEIIINGKDISFWSQYIVDNKGSDDGKSGIFIKLQLPVDKYIICRSKCMKIPLNEAPFLVSHIKTYAKKVRVHARSEINDFVVKFVSISGSDGFSPIDTDAAKAGRVSMENKRLLMPGQGHMLVFVRVQTPQDGSAVR